MVGRSRSEKMTGPGQQDLGTASAPNEPLNSVAHCTVANRVYSNYGVRGEESFPWSGITQPPSRNAKGRFPFYTDKQIANRCAHSSLP